ncbi:MAG TPA: hypothetical protein VIV06_07755, partial [Candidatus Limnocylindrales bacterium]
ARFLFRGDDVFKEVRMLSGGERSRLELALLGILPSNLLLLDEPTNHLDIPAREAIEAFLEESPATVLVVSHDRRLLETVCDRLWVVSDALAVPFDGGWREWRVAIADGWTAAGAAEREMARLHHRVGVGGTWAGGGPPLAERAGADGRTGRRHKDVHAGKASGGSAADDGTSAAGDRRSAADGTRSAPAAASARRLAVADRAKLSKDAYRRQREAVDADLTRLGLRKGHLELALGDPSTAANFVELRRITSELADVERALVAAEDAWLELEERAP